MARQADHGIDVTILEQLGADAFFGTTTKQHTVGKNDRHHALFLQVGEAVQQKGEVGS